MTCGEGAALALIHQKLHCLLVGVTQARANSHEGEAGKSERTAFFGGEYKKNSTHTKVRIERKVYWRRGNMPQAERAWSLSGRA